MLTCTFLHCCFAHVPWDCSSGSGTLQQDVEVSLSSLGPVWTRRRLDSVDPQLSWTATSLGPRGLCSLCAGLFSYSHSELRALCFFWTPPTSPRHWTPGSTSPADLKRSIVKLKDFLGGATALAAAPPLSKNITRRAQ